MVGSQQEENICLWFGWEPVCAGRSTPMGQFLFFLCSDRNPTMPLIYLWGRFSKALQLCLALLLQPSSARTRNPTWGRDHQVLHPWSSSGLVPSLRGCFHPSLGAKCCLKNCCVVLWKLKFFPEFSVTCSRGDCRGVGE